MNINSVPSHFSSGIPEFLIGGSSLLIHSPISNLAPCELLQIDYCSFCLKFNGDKQILKILGSLAQQKRVLCTVP